MICKFMMFVYCENAAPHPVVHQLIQDIIPSKSLLQMLKTQDSMRTGLSSSRSLMLEYAVCVWPLLLLVCFYRFHCGDGNCSRLPISCNMSQSSFVSPKHQRTQSANKLSSHTDSQSHSPPPHPRIVWCTPLVWYTTVGGVRYEPHSFMVKMAFHTNLLLLLRGGHTHAWWW